MARSICTRNTRARPFCYSASIPAGDRPAGRRQDSVYAYVGNSSMRNTGLQWLAPIGFNNAYAP